MVARIAETYLASGKARARTDPLRVLLIASRFELPYRVLRCAQAGGAEVYVLGNPAAAPLRFSRHCKRFFLSKHLIQGQSDPALAMEISSIARRFSIEMIIPADDISMRTTITNEGLLQSPCFPHPTLSQFDILNNKWTFAELCREISLPHPSTRLLSDRSEVRLETQSCSPEHALIAKPLSLSGGEGIVVFDGTDSDERLQSISYRPILLQEFIYGGDLCATLYAREGSIQTFMAYSVHRKTYTAYHDERLYTDLARLVRHLDLDGVYNFDIRIKSDGSLYYLECNPRFFHKINLSMVAGINFVRIGLPSADPEPTTPMSAPVQVRLPQAAMRCAPWRLTRRDFAMAAYFLSDPLPCLIEKLRLHSPAIGSSNARYYRPT